MLAWSCGAKEESEKINERERQKPAHISCTAPQSERLQQAIIDVPIFHPVTIAKYARTYRKLLLKSPRFIYLPKG